MYIKRRQNATTQTTPETNNEAERESLKYFKGRGNRGKGRGRGKMKPMPGFVYRPVLKPRNELEAFFQSNMNRDDEDEDDVRKSIFCLILLVVTHNRTIW